MKKILLSLFVGLIGLINFGYCELIDGNTVGIIVRYTSTTSSVTFNNLTDGMKCFNMDQSGTPGKLTIGDDKYILNGYKTYCTDTNNDIVLSTNGVNRLQYYYFYFPYNGLIGEFYPQYTSLQCQTEYNLIPVSSVDENYCINNNLCPSQGECPDNPGDYTGDLIYSNIYINNILHPGKQNIFINIPDYITWDYSQNEVDFNVYVGSGYDVDYINSIVDINSYRPTSTDFTNVFVGGLALVFPYIFVALLILFIWKLIKRIFK